jgi:hypothetical protein
VGRSGADHRRAEAFAIVVDTAGVAGVTQVGLADATDGRRWCGIGRVCRVDTCVARPAVSRSTAVRAGVRASAVGQRRVGDCTITGRAVRQRRRDGGNRRGVGRGRIGPRIATGIATRHHEKRKYDRCTREPQKALHERPPIGQG